jgi:hypothetical protein
MSDIVERLRSKLARSDEFCSIADVLVAAADEIERLAVERDGLRAALREVETVMMMVEPRSHKAEYLDALASIRAALEKP